MASVGESVSTNNRKGDGQRELQEEANESKKRSIAICKYCGFVGWEKIAGEQIFSNPAAFMKSLLCIPHPNASTKRTFSMVLKIITENRTSLHSDTVCSLLNCKLNCARIAAGFKPFKLQLNAAE